MRQKVAAYCELTLVGSQLVEGFDHPLSGVHGVEILSAPYFLSRQRTAVWHSAHTRIARMGHRLFPFLSVIELNFLSFKTYRYLRVTNLAATCMSSW